MSTERRRYPRVSIERTDIRLAASNSRQPEVGIARLVDFSLGGLLIELAEGQTPPREGSLLDVALAWPEGEHRFDASVRRVVEEEGKRRVGVEFDDPELVEKLLGAWLKKGED